MARKVFISFRFDDGSFYKDKLSEIFDDSTDIINRSEDEDRSQMSEDTIQKYLYEKLSDTSVTIVLLTPMALNHRKDFWGRYDDWMYDEIRYSLEDRDNNRTNGLIAIYTPEAESSLISSTTHSCSICNTTKKVTVVSNIDNLARKNMMNIKSNYKTNPCSNIFDSTWDSYCQFVSWDDFKSDYKKYIENACEKRDMLYKYNLCKRL